jgi:1,4-alpha-glucan branching enzyme
MVRDLNGLYRRERALHGVEFEWQGFEWIDCHDARQSVLAFLRRAGDAFLVVVANLTPVPRHGYRIGVPSGGRFEEVLNTDSSLYGGSDVGNGDRRLEAESLPWMGRPWSLELTLPPLGVIVLRPAGP